MASRKRKKTGRVEFVHAKEEELTVWGVICRLLSSFFKKFDVLQILPLLLLLTIGLLFIRSTGQQLGGHHLQLFDRQLCYLAIGFFCWICFFFIDYRWLGPFTFLFYPGTILMLLAVLKFGPIRNNAHRWLDFGSVSIQPSEFGKLAVLLAVSWILARKRANINNFLWILMVGIFTAIPFLLILKEPDLGTSLVLVIVALGVMFAAHIKWRYILLALLIVTAAAPIAFANLKNYQRERILTFLDPERDPLNRGWNAIQSEMAVGTGGLLGKGYGQGTHCTLGYLPQMVADSDFIFPVIAEETGFAGSCILIILYALLLFSVFRTALLASDMFGRYLCVGVGTLLLAHVTINIGMCVRLLPITGLPLPLVSYGGTFLVAMMIYLGIVQSVYAHRGEKTMLTEDI